ncbi:hypothetical protein [Dyadobacter fermentans]|uniref:hypothetical protein n=1 Tax=Dyadobacter fermentans TaxID=94254 RepID=UPI001CC03E8F|nr:hypothetical protein [Dyadobacter fermentans]MBZ1362149.1 hypothetical protein [Dyadobacter fermentans]
MKIDLQEVSPALAEELLSGNVSNRPLSKHHVSFLADQIKAGAWQVTGDPVKISSAGRVLDGQHRLHAIIQSGIPVQVFIASDVPDEVFTVLDTGKVRSAKDVLGIENMKSPYDQAAVARTYLMYRDGTIRSKSRSYTNQEILDFCRANDVLYHVNMAQRFFHKGAPIQRTTIAFSSFLLYMIDAKYAGQFMDALCLGVNVRPGTAMCMLREKLTKAAMGRYDLSKWEIIALIIKAWNMDRSGGELPTMLIYNPDREDFPKAV